MADLKISQLTSLNQGDLAGNDQLAIVDVGSTETKKITSAALIAGGVTVVSDGTIPVSKLVDGTARQLLQTNAAGTNVEWASNIDIPGTLDVTGAATFDAAVTTTGLISANGKVSFPLGSAALPSLYPGTDTNTGIYSPGADQVAISTNGTGRLFVDASGRLLVGTSSFTANATAVLQGGSSGSTVAANLWISRGSVPTPGSDNLGFIRFSDNAQNEGAYLQVFSEGSWTAGSSHATSVAIGTAPSGSATAVERLRITSDGRLGLGTSSPNELLEVTGNIHMSGAADRTIFNRANNALSLGTNNTTRLHITNAGNVGIGTTTPSTKLVVSDAGANGLEISPSTGATSLIQSFNRSTSAYSALSYAASQHVITDGATERARIDSSGRLLVGTSTNTNNVRFNQKLAVVSIGSDNIGGASLTTYGGASAAVPALLDLQRSRGTTDGSMTVVADGDNLGSINFRGADGTKFVNAAIIRAEVDGTPGADDMPGRLVFSTTADGAASPTERMRIQADGDILFNKTTDDLNVAGAVVTSLGAGSFTRAGGIGLFVGRNTDDGALVVFRQDGTDEGSISVSGTTVSYNGAHLSRWSQLPGGAERTEILRGTVLSNIDEMCDWGEEDNEQLNRMKVSDVEGDKNVSGVFQAWDDDDDTYTDDFYCAMTGDFIIRIAESVTVQRGDLLMSAGDGTAKPQDDDIIRSKTVAKVTSTHVTCIYDDGSYCVPCVLMAC
jgi:hypothetical protein